MTHLKGNVLVFKDHPRIAFRGWIDALEAEIADLEATVNDPKRIRKIIMDELTQVKKKYAVPRRTEILYDYQAEEDQGEEDETPDYPVNLFLSQEGYFKKITPQSLRMSGEQKYKDGDGPFLTWSLQPGRAAGLYRQAAVL